MYEKKTALVIGSGIAGLSSAYHLTKAGYKVHILEASNNLGGRLTAFFDSISEEIIENGQHALLTAYHNFLSILTELNIDKSITFQDYLRVKYLDTNGKISELNCGRFSGKLGLIAGLLLFDGISITSKIKIISLFLKLQFNDNYSSHLTCLEYLKLNMQSDDAIDKFWTPFILATMNSDPKEASAQILINILQKAFISDIKNSKLGFANIDYKEILSPILSYILANGGEISYNSFVTRVEVQSNEIKGVWIKGKFIEANLIISAIQPFSLYKIIPDEYKDYFKYLNQFEYSSIISIYIWLENPLFEDYFLAILNSPIQWIFNRRKLLVTKNNFKFPSSYSITISSADDIAKMKRVELIELISNELNKLFPEFKNTNILHYRIITEKFATIKQTPHSDNLRAKVISNINNLYFAGDWTNTHLPATIESATYSGKSISEIIINKYK